MRKILGMLAFAAVIGATAVVGARAGHNGAVVDVVPATCSETVVSAAIADPAGTHKVSNMYLVVDTDDGSEQSENVPTDGTSAMISVGPFSEDTIVSWNVFGGGERSYDQPLWNGYGGATFSTDIANYAASQGGSYSWVIAGTDDPNPFVNWNEVLVSACAPATMDDCKKGGYEAYGFKNQGQCVSSVQANEHAGK